MPVYISNYKNTNEVSGVNRVLFSLAWTLLARWMPRWLGNKWRIFLLREFGAKISWNSGVHPSAKIYYPKNLEMGDYACLASRVNCYCVDKVIIGANSTVSEGAFLCTASHDITDPENHLITAPIVIKDQVWVAADAFIGMGVTIGQGAVVGARACVFKNVEPWTIMGGNPARKLKKRILKEE